jgi:hypothetical protein
VPGPMAASARTCSVLPEKCEDTLGAQEWFSMAARGYMPSPSLSSGRMCRRGTTAMAFTRTWTRQQQMHQIGEGRKFKGPPSAFQSNPAYMLGDTCIAQELAVFQRTCLSKAPQDGGGMQLCAIGRQAAEEGFLHDLLCGHSVYMGVQVQQPGLLRSRALRQSCQVCSQDRMLWQQDGPGYAAKGTARPVLPVQCPMLSAAVPGQRAALARDGGGGGKRPQAEVASL